MLPKEWTLAALALAAGFAGGAISTGLGTVFAQERTRQITAERFVVVDASGKKRGEFGLDGQGSLNLNLYNDQGRLLWSAPTRSGIFPISPSQ
ncbi:MAG: hypothetical protein JO099_07245 [Acidobacteriia bacterium]|nr:hypothetical protein [Terriglobia bacterium]